MDDLISRQAAIDALHTWFRDGFDKDRWWNSTHVLAAIEGLPSAQPEPRWIPVTERLPEENQPVLITDGAVMGVCSLVRTDDGYKWENNMGYWLDFDEWKAWMPLPEPYKEEEDE